MRPYHEVPPPPENNMEHNLAMQIVGGVALIIGMRMNIDPVGFNKSIFGDVEGIESGESSAMRMAIGGGRLLARNRQHLLQLQRRWMRLPERPF